MASSVRDQRSFLPNALSIPHREFERCPTHSHSCLLYESQEEQFAATIPFLRVGLERGEKCLYVVDDNTADAVTAALRVNGIDADTAIASGALAIVTKHDTYLKHGDFDPEWLLGFLQEAIRAAEAEGFTHLRATGEMTWAVDSQQHEVLGRLIDYECKLNEFLRSHNVVALCQYNRRRFRPETLLQVIDTHPFMICGDLVCENQHYIPPEVFDRTKYDAESELDRLVWSIQQNAALKRNLAAEAAQARQASAEALRWRGLYEAVLANTPDLGYVIGLDHRFTYANHALLQLWGRTWDDAIGKSFLELGYDPPAAAMHEREIEQVIATRKPIRGDAPCKVDQERRIYDYIFFPVFGENGEVIAVGGNSRDITDRKMMEEALRKSEKQLASDLADMQHLHRISVDIGYEDAPQSFYEKVLDAAIAITRSDVGSMQMLYPERGSGGELRLLASRGFSPRTAQFWEWVRADSQSTCGAALRTGERVIVPDVEQCEWMKGTEYLTTYRQSGVRAVQSTPLISRGGKLLGMISTYWREPHKPSEHDLRLLEIVARQAADLMDRRQAQERQKQSDAALRKSEKFAGVGRMAATIAHEFYDPLEAIINLWYLASQDESLSSNAQELLKTLGAELSRVTHITQKTHEFYLHPRPEMLTGFDGETPGPVDLAQPLNAAAGLFSGKTETKGIRIETHYRTSATVFGFPGELRQVFANLISNSLEAGATIIKIRVSPYHGWKHQGRRGVRIVFADNGSGVPAEFAGKIFGPFISTKEEKGTGLGLWVSKAIMQKHEGWMRLRTSTQPDHRGTTFQLFFPAL